MMTQEQIAYLSDLSVAHYARIERGEMNPSLKTLEKITNVIGINLCQLFENNCITEPEKIKKYNLSDLQNLFDTLTITDQKRAYYIIGELIKTFAK